MNTHVKAQYASFNGKLESAEDSNEIACCSRFDRLNIFQWTIPDADKIDNLPFNA